MEINGQQVQEVYYYRDMGLSDATMKALDKKGFTQATPIQGGAIPYFMEWKDVVAKAPTGTGKTFAFGIPMVEHIDPDSDAVQGLILAPTRELAIQIRDELRDLCAFREGVRTVCLEADRMLDMGFIQDVTRILDKMPHRRNLGLFSATISREVMDISWVYQRDPAEITVRPVEENRPDIQQYAIELMGREQKLDTMSALLTHGGYERAIAFCNTKNMTDRLAGLLKMRGFPCEAIHGDIPQKERERTLQRFKEGKLQVLVATDVAARGLDIDDVDAVFNYDVPDEQEYYIHRIGRTGRAKKHGVAYTLMASVTESVKMRDIARNTRMEIQLLKYDKDGCLMVVEQGDQR